MNYMEMIKQRNPGKLALVEDGIEYTYGLLAEMAMNLSRDETVFGELSGRDTGNRADEKKQLHRIQREKILDQLTEFLASMELGLVPVLVPMDYQGIESGSGIGFPTGLSGGNHNVESGSEAVQPEIDIPQNVCMAVATSGTSGVPKILYRSYESWADFFPIQNKIFGIHEDSRLFAQGSLAFTGNLNLYMAQFFAGATVVAQNTFSPRQWVQVMEQQEVDAIYLIPSKLLCLPQIMQEQNLLVRRILSGSQSLGKSDALELKRFFPKAEILLYYGASELSYVTYITDGHMNQEKNLIGKPFPGVGVSVSGGEIYVDTPYHAEGISCPYTLSDKGYMDEEGNLYFDGRSDDIIGIRGRKVSVCRIENALNSLRQVRESTVLPVQKENQVFLIAFVQLRDISQVTDSFHHERKDRKGNGRTDLFGQYAKQGSRFLGEIKDGQFFAELRKALAHFEMPCRIIMVDELPRKESGKIEKETLEQEWEEYFSP